MQLQMIWARFGSRCHHFSASDPASQCSTDSIALPLFGSLHYDVQRPWQFFQNFAKVSQQSFKMTSSSRGSSTQCKQLNLQTYQYKNHQMLRRAHSRRSWFNSVSLLLTSLVFSPFIFQCDMWLQTRIGLFVAFWSFEEWFLNTFSLMGP